MMVSSLIIVQCCVQCEYNSQKKEVNWLYGCKHMTCNGVHRDSKKLLWTEWYDGTDRDCSKDSKARKNRRKRYQG